MYNIAKNVQIVITLLKAHNIKTLVLSPGGTNAPFVRGVQDDDFFTCYSIVDERSAAYFALGLSLSMHEPVVICCTSAQATRNYLPGLTEAFYKGVPILALTFSKHPQYTYQGYMQAPDQTSVPNDAVKKTFSLPYVSNGHDFLHCSRLVNEAILELQHFKSGPIQLNVPMLDNELGEDSVESLPVVKVIKRYGLTDIEKINIDAKKILLIIGENSNLTYHDIKEFADNHNVVVYTNHLSNVNGEHCMFGNLLLSCVSQDYFDEYICPDIVITCGGQTGDYPLYHKIADSKKKFEHWSIEQDGMIRDTYDRLTRIYECNPLKFFNSFTTKVADHDYGNLWKESFDKLERNVPLPLSNIYLAQQLTPLIPECSIVNFAILNSLRSWSFFQFNNNVKCSCNVGAFGIDGGLSSFLGQSCVSENLCFYITGDLAFYYDMNALGIKYIRNNVRILLVNNNGGIEFKLWGNHAINKMTDRFIAAAGHFKNAKGWAETCGFDYIPIYEKEEFDEKKNVLLTENDAPILMEVFVSDLQESEAYKKFLSRNRDILEPSFRFQVKSVIKGIIGKD